MSSTGQISVPRFRSDCLLSQGIEVGDLLKVRKEAVLYVQPCSTERGKLMADIELTKEPKLEFIDPKTLCSLLEIHRRHFADLKCSASLGVAKLKWKGREISVFKSGKLKIQRALDRDEILRVANSISRLVWGATVCAVCGQPVLNCASGKCGQCASAEKVTIQLSEIPNAELLQQGYESLARSRALPADAEALISRARYLALHFTVEAQRKEDAALGLVLLSESERLDVESKP